MRIITVILLVLLLLLQYPLWSGRGGWLRVHDLQHQIEIQQQANRITRARNNLLDAEVLDLQQGTDAIEERARSKLGMVKNDEIYFQVFNESDHPLAVASSIPVVPVRHK